MTEDPEKYARLVYDAFVGSWQEAHEMGNGEEASETWDEFSGLLHRLAVSAGSAAAADDLRLLADIAADHAESAAR